LARSGQKLHTPRLKNPGKLANSIFFSTQVLTPVDSSVWTRVCQPWQTQLAKWHSHFGTAPALSGVKQRMKRREVSEHREAHAFGPGSKATNVLENLVCALVCA